MDPRTISQGIERNGSVPRGTEDRFAGYAIIGLPFASGHVLSLRRFPASRAPDLDPGGKTGMVGTCGLCQGSLNPTTP